MKFFKSALLSVSLISCLAFAEQESPHAKKNDSVEDIKGAIVEPSAEQKAQLEAEVQKAQTKPVAAPEAKAKKAKKAKKKKKSQSTN